MYISYAYVKDNGRMKCRGNGHRLYRHRSDIYTPSACHPRLHTAKTSPPACHIVDDWGFLYATPSDGIYTGCPSHLSLATTSFCPSAVQPLEIRGRSDNTTPTASYTVVSQCLHHALLRRRRSYPRTATLEHSSRGQLFAACLCFAVYDFPGIPEPPP